MDFGLNPAQRRLQEEARRLAQGELASRAADIDRSEEYPWDNVHLLKEAEFFGMTIPKEYGGRGLSYFDAVLVIEQIAQACGVTARIVVEANMGAVGAIMEYGSPAQKRLAADLVLAGDKPAICITEKEAGSAASDMTTRADRRGDRFVINGGKHWITGGGVSRLHLVFARVFDQNGEEEGIGGFIAVRDETKGLRIGKREPAMGLRGIPETEIFFDDMAVPASALLIPPRGLAKGFADLMNAYNGQRIGAATVALGIAEGAYELALAHSQQREQFGRPISEFQGLQWMLADMATQIAAAQALIYKAATRGGNGFPEIMEAAQAKVFTSEMAVAVTNDALQLHGSAGYSRNHPLERMVRDARMFTIGGGTAQILRTVIAARLLNRRLPQTRHGYLREAGGPAESTGGLPATRRRAAT
jgi:3-sulfinopropanoyl-CoA desulfinase